MSTTKTGKQFNLVHAFKVADRFSEAAHLLSRQLPKTMDFVDPYIVTAAFSLEVYLKCLYFIETGGIMRGHHLKKLYDNLSSDTKRRIKWDYDKLTAKSKMARDATRLVKHYYGEDMNWDLEYVLEESSRAFERWRYAFEGNPGAFPAYGQLKEVLRRRILHLQPDLNSE